jgi:hypothetical protein
MRRIVRGLFETVRRGWCLGGAPFREQLLGQMAGGMGEHHGGEERQERAVAEGEHDDTEMDRAPSEDGECEHGDALSAAGRGLIVNCRD